MLTNESNIEFDILLFLLLLSSATGKGVTVFVRRGNDRHESADQQRSALIGADRSKTKLRARSQLKMWMGVSKLRFNFLLKTSHSLA
jgi:hypothetical protein